MKKLKDHSQIKSACNLETGTYTLQEKIVQFTSNSPKNIHFKVLSNFHHQFQISIHRLALSRYSSILN